MLAQALSTARHAVELDANNVYALLALSCVQFYRREFAEAGEINRRLLLVNPTNPEVLAQIGWRTQFAGDWDKGTALLREAIARSIKAPYWYPMFIAFDHYCRGEYRAALAELEPIADVKFVWVPLLVAATHGQLGSQQEARRALDQANALNPTVLKDPRAAMRVHNFPESLADQLIGGLVKAGLPAPAPTN